MKRTELLQTLKLAVPALLPESELVLPVLKSFRFTGGTVSAFNDVIAVNLETGLDVEAIIPGRKLATFLSSCKTKEVKFSKTNKGNVIARCGSSKLTLAADAHEDWPFEFPDIEEALAYDLNEGFFKALELCSSQTPDTGGASWVGGITFVFAKEMTLYGLGKGRSTISQHKVHDLAPGPAKTEKMIVPSSFCKTAVAIAKVHGYEAELHVVKEGLVITWDEGRQNIFGKEIPKGGPDIIGRFNDILSDVHNPIEITDPMRDAFKRAAALGKEGTCEVQDTEAGLQIKARAGGDAVLNETVKLDKDTVSIDVLVAADLISKRMPQCAVISFTDSATILQSESRDFVYLVANRNEGGEDE